MNDDNQQAEIHLENYHGLMRLVRFDMASDERIIRIVVPCGAQAKKLITFKIEEPNE
jgi:hypothetical protein